MHTPSPKCRPSPPNAYPLHLDTDPLPLDADPPSHGTCDTCWEATPMVDRQTPVKTLPCPKLRLRTVIIFFCIRKTKLVFFLILALLLRRRGSEVLIPRQSQDTEIMCRCGERPNSDYEIIHTQDGRVLIILLPKW